MVFAPARPSWHAWWPLLAVDRIWYCGLRLHSSRVLRGGTARWASDHLPLVADFYVASAVAERCGVCTNGSIDARGAVAVQSPA